MALVLGTERKSLPSTQEAKNALSHRISSEVILFVDKLQGLHWSERTEMFQL